MKHPTTQHKRRRHHSVYALIIGAIVQALGGAWASVPGALIDRLPRWAPFAVSGCIFVYGLWGAYTQRDKEE
jgi:hypothetical protein